MKPLKTPPVAMIITGTSLAALPWIECGMIQFLKWLAALTRLGVRRSEHFINAYMRPRSSCDSVSAILAGLWTAPLAQQNSLALGL